MKSHSKPALVLSEIVPFEGAHIERGGTTAILDSETWPILPALKAPKLVCLQSKTSTHPPLISTTPDGIAHEMGEILKHDRIVGYNIAYDMTVVGNAAPSLLKPIFDAYSELRVRDVMIAAQMQDLRSGLFYVHKGWKMSQVAGRLLDDYEDHKTDVQLRYHEVDGTPIHQWPPEFIEYPKADLRWTERLDDRIPDQPDEDYQAQSSFPLKLASCWGVGTDLEAVQALEKSLRHEFVEMTTECKKQGLVRPNGTKNMTLVQRLVEESWQALYDEEPPKTPKGGVCTERVILQGCKNPDLEPYIRRQRAEKGLSTYIPYMLEGAKRPICFNFNTLVETGRSSSFDPNGQNIFAFGGFRPCFVPRPGYKFVIADYSINELRCLAQIQYDWFGESDLGDVIRSGGDPHTELAAVIFDVDPVELRAQYKAGDKQASVKRSTAKGPNFGAAGGMAGKGMRMYVMRNTGKQGNPTVLTVNECKRHISAWKKRWTQMGRYFDKVRVQKGFATLARTGFQRGGMTYCANCNFHFQGLAAAGMKRAHFEVARRAYTEPSSDIYGSRPWLVLHDELFMESPEERAQAAARELETVMEEEMNKLTPDVPSKVDAGVYDRWEEK